MYCKKNVTTPHRVTCMYLSNSGSSEVAVFQSTQSSPLVENSTSYSTLPQKRKHPQGHCPENGQSKASKRSIYVTCKVACLTS